MKEPRQKMSGTREVASPANPILKVFRRALAEGTTREGWLAMEGPLPLEEALKPGGMATVQSVLVSASAADKFHSLIGRLPADTELVKVSDRMFEQLAATETPQGIAALVELHPPGLDAILARHGAILLVCCGVQDPGNMGTMVRSAQALGAAALVTLPETVNPFNAKALRASAGAVLRLPIFRNLQTNSFIERLRKARVRIVATNRYSPKSVAQTDLTGSLAILIGKEASGLPPELARAADELLSIPIHQETDSLNAATAAGIFLYEAARQRGFIQGDKS